MYASGNRKLYSALNLCQHVNGVFLGFLQTGIVPEFILFFDCPEAEMERRVLRRNQVDTWMICSQILSTESMRFVGCYVDFLDCALQQLFL